MNLLQGVDQGLHRLYRWCGYVAALFIVAIAGLVIVNILSRLFGAFVPGMTEGAGYCMAAAGSLGLAYTFGEHGHIRVEMLLQRLTAKARYGFELWALAVGTLLTGYLGWYLARMVWVSRDFGDRSDGSDALLIWIPQAPTAAGFIIFAISLVHALVAALARRPAADG